MCSRPSVCVVGAGAIGGWIAARLSLGGHRVSVLARGELLRRIDAEGIRLVEGAYQACATVRASGDAAELGPQQLVILAVKAPALAAAAEAARPLIDRETIILPLLNGVPWWFLERETLGSVDSDGRIARVLPAAQVVGSVVHAAVSRQAPNEIFVKHADRLILGEPFGGSSDRVERLASLFSEAGVTTESSTDVRTAIWYKLWGNATINPLSALTRAPADRLIADDALRAFMLEAMAELRDIGAAIGCPIAQTGEDRMAVTARLGSFKPSMLQDVEAGRQIELEALVGAPREIARARGIPTPALDRIYAMTRLMAEQLGLL